MADKCDEEAERLLPCRDSCANFREIIRPSDGALGNLHVPECPSKYRQPIAAALRARDADITTLQSSMLSHEQLKKDTDALIVELHAEILHMRIEIAALKNSLDDIRKRDDERRGM